MNFAQKNKTIFRLVFVTVFILLIPLVAMQFTDEVAWTFSDFVFAGVLIFGTGLAYELISRKTGTIAYRFAVGFALAAAFLLIWINGAVGIIGNEDNPANLLYGGVLAILFLGSIIVFLKPRGMSHVLFVTAVAQALVPVIALLIWQPASSWGTLGVLGVFALNAFFVLLFIGSGILFRRAAQETSGGGVESKFSK